jgi:hypothetical protein
MRFINSKEANDVATQITFQKIIFISFTAFMVFLVIISSFYKHGRFVLRKAKEEKLKA